MSTEKSELEGVDQEGSTASSKATTLLRECFGEMPSLRVIFARLVVLGVLVAMCAVGMVILAAWAWFAVRVIG